MSDVVDWGGVTNLPTNPARVIEHAAGANLTSVVVVGFDSDGNEYFRSSEADGAEALWLLERARHKLLSLPDA